MNENDFVNEAVEGLQKFEEKRFTVIFDQLNKDLTNILKRKKPGENEKKFKENPGCI